MHRCPSLTRACTLLAVALAASACSGEGSGVYMAGGTRAKPPVVLTLANHQQGPDQVQAWIDELQRRSGGSLRIQVTNRWLDHEFAYDKATIADVQAGRVQLAKVNARAYEAVGVNSFQALLAPFLIDNPTLEQRVPESDLAGEMLAGTSRLGLVGLAMQPTDLRNRQACRVRWWRSRTTGCPHRHSGRRGRQGDLHRLGATPVGIAQADRSGGSTEPNSIYGTSMTCRRKRHRPGVSLSTPGGR
jgi:Bacterial extracellular solute-binding protein, family 7